MATYSSANSKTVAAPVNSTWLSTYDAMLEPAVIRRLYQNYGKQFGAIDFLRMSGQEINLARDTITSFAEGAQERPVKVKSNVTALTLNGSGNYEFQFYIDGDDYDSNSLTYLRIGDSILIPGYYFGQTHDVTARVYEVGATAASLTKAVLFNGTLGATNTLTQTFPADGYLQVGHTSYARGSGQPAARQFGFYSDSFKTAISKETIAMHGGVQAQEMYFDVKSEGRIKGKWGMHFAKADFALDKQQSTNIWQGEENSNTSNLTETDVDSASGTIKGTQGMWLHAEDNGSDHEYVDTFTVRDLDAVDDLFKATGVMTTEASILVGHKLYKQIQDSAHDYIQTYSGGTDLLTDNMSKVGFTASKWERSGIVYKLCNLAELSNNQTYGANQKNFWNYAGLVIPSEQVTVDDTSSSIYNSEGRLGGKVTLANVSLGYLNNNQENRTRIVTDVAGVNGMGFKATEQYDRSQLFMLSEYGVIANETSKWVRLYKDGTN